MALQTCPTHTPREQGLGKATPVVTIPARLSHVIDGSRASAFSPIDHIDLHVKGRPHFLRYEPTNQVRATTRSREARNGDRTRWPILHIDRTITRPTGSENADKNSGAGCSEEAHS